MTTRTAWQCPNCSRWNAPHVDQCDCVPAPVEPPTTEKLLSDILEEIHKLEAQGFNWRYLPMPYYPPPIYVYPPPQPYRVVPAPTVAPWTSPYSPFTISSGGTTATDTSRITYNTTNGQLSANVQ